MDPAESRTLLQLAKDFSGLMVGLSGVFAAYISLRKFRESRSEREQMKELA